MIKMIRVIVASKIIIKKDRNNIKASKYFVLNRNNNNQRLHSFKMALHSIQVF